MDKFNIILASSLFFITILAIPIYSQQIPYYIEPSEISAVANEIETKLGGFINVSSSDIVNHLSGAFVGFNYTQNCLSSTPTIIDETATSVTLSIPSNQFALKYRISSFNLKNGTEIVEEKQPSSNDKYTLSNLTDGIYIYTVQEICNLGPSMLWIIIEDKDLYNIHVFPDDNLPCYCNPDGTPIDVTDGQYYSGYPYWPPVAQGQKFQIEVDYLPEEPPAIIAGKREYFSDIMRLNFTCNPNISFEPIQLENESFLILTETTGNGIVEHGLLRVGQPGYEPFDGTYAGYLNLMFQYCQNNTKKEYRTEHTGNLSAHPENYPNPVQNTLNIAFENPENSDELEILFYRSDGVLAKKINRKILAKTNVLTESLNVENLSPGFYKCVLKTGKTIKIISMIKE